MNLRFLGGWFLAIAGISILLTMGCEKGALGVKPATVVGQVVDKDNPSVPVANAVVRMISKEQVGTSELVQGNNFVSAVTGADGKFVFESVNADNVVFEYTAPGYSSMIYPKTSSGGDSTGQESATAQIEFVSIRSGAFVDLRMLPLEKISNPLPEEVSIKLDLVDATTKKPIDKNYDNTEALKFTISFNGTSYTKSAQMWRDEGIKIRAASSIKTVIRNEPVGSGASVYNSRDDVTLVGSSDVYQRVEMTPVTYQLSLRCLNVPDYIVGSQAAVNLFAEIPAYDFQPAQIVKSAVMQAYGDLYVLELPGVVLQSALGIHLRIQTRGYYDEIVHITSTNLKEGAQGNYRLDINFLHNNNSMNGTQSTPITYDPADAARSVVGLYDNMKRRDVAVYVTNLQPNDIVSMAISLPHTGVNYDLPYPLSPTSAGQSTGGEPVIVTFSDVAVGFNMSYSLALTRGAESFSISKSNLMINPENEPTPSTLMFAVNWLVEYNKLAQAAD
ncbi:MAG TPA: carboxypeptidase-like regulatory domain-containing protein [Candidatus Rifleibacterium sp.]|nr:carboxypeptidase-like regulatory domain-containing protein [Candidatus Rifleibacterium sp.]HPT46369.1 carboxypeptidase-like regulatory domain-containing protein [Candidatus Rifleibacterium sp.]